MVSIVQANFSSGSSISDALDMTSTRIVGMQFGAIFTGSLVTFLAGDHMTGSFVSVYKEDGSEVSASIGTNKYIGINEALSYLSPVNYLKLRAGTSGSPSVQGNVTAIKLHGKD